MTDTVGGTHPPGPGPNSPSRLGPGPRPRRQATVPPAVRTMGTGFRGLLDDVRHARHQAKLMFEAIRSHGSR